MGEVFTIVDPAVADIVPTLDAVGVPTGLIDCVPTVIAVVLGTAVLAAAEDATAASLEVQNPRYGVTTLSWLGCAVL